MKKFLTHIIYDILLYLIKFKLFKIIYKIIFNVFLFDQGYCTDWEYLRKKNKNNLFIGECILIKKFTQLNIKNCIDIGANIGNYSKELLNNNCKVIAFEPLSRCNENLSIIKNENKDNFSFYELALSNKNGFDYINFDDEKGELSSLEISINELDFINNEKRIKVKLGKLDNYIDDKKFQNIDFIKIDTEGHEIKVLKGGINFIRKNKIKVLQVEFNIYHLFNGQTTIELSKLLDGYILTQLNPINGKLKVVNPKNFLSNIYLLTNFVFIEKNYFTKYMEILLK